MRASGLTGLWILLWWYIVNVNAWFITAPTTKADWMQTASLVVNVFDAPTKAASPVERIAWQVVGRSLAETSTYRQYVSTARKMQGTKYAILLAKSEWGKVIGMAELGVKRNNEGECQAIIGVLCVDEKYHKQGVGNALVRKCQEIVETVWKQDSISAEVEPSNDGAIAFFESCGFQRVQGTRVMVSLRRGGRELEQRPHLLLTYNLTGESGCASEALT